MCCGQQPVWPAYGTTPVNTASLWMQTWASQQIRGLSKGRIDDPSVLLDVLMDTPSNGEVVEGCLVNIERNGNVSAFATEFIR